jgi:hypothetical protein
MEIVCNVYYRWDAESFATNDIISQFNLIITSNKKCIKKTIIIQKCGTRRWRDRSVCFILCPRERQHNWRVQYLCIGKWFYVRRRLLFLLDATWPDSIFKQISMQLLHCALYQRHSLCLKEYMRYIFHSLGVYPLLSLDSFIWSCIIWLLLLPRWSARLRLQNAYYTSLLCKVFSRNILLARRRGLQRAERELWKECSQPENWFAK